MKIFEDLGKKAIGSRLRLLTDSITADAAAIYTQYGIDMNPKWFPVYYTLSNAGQSTITNIAKEIGHSHASVSKIISEMKRKGLVNTGSDKSDGRKNMASLSSKGKLITQRIQHQYEDVGNAIEELSTAAAHDLWKAIEEWEFLLEQKSLLKRVEEKRKQRESGNVSIVNYEPRYKKAFKSLNEEWISQWFRMEPADHKALDNPSKNIISKGGHILVAIHNDIPVGVCALMKMDDDEYDYELAKMAVAPGMRGKNIGLLLGNAIVEKARSLGANKLYLESNTILKPAINLYLKLGFRKVSTRPSPYERSNIQMELINLQERK